MARAARESFPRRNFPPGGSPLPIPELLNLLLHVTVTAWFKPEGRVPLRRRQCRHDLIYHFIGMEACGD